jgi:hypothetical protein
VFLSDIMIQIASRVRGSDKVVVQDLKEPMKMLKKCGK